MFPLSSLNDNGTKQQRDQQTKEGCVNMKFLYDVLNVVKEHNAKFVCNQLGSCRREVTSHHDEAAFPEFIVYLFRCRALHTRHINVRTQ